MEASSNLGPCFFKPGLPKQLWGISDQFLMGSAFIIYQETVNNVFSFQTTHISVAESF